MNNEPNNLETRALAVSAGLVAAYVAFGAIAFRITARHAIRRDAKIVEDQIRSGNLKIIDVD